MSQDPEDMLMESICRTIEKNGFPHKKVALPWSKLEKAATDRELDLDMILSRLSFREIYSQKQGDRLVFSDSDFVEEKQETAEDGNGFGFDADALKNFDFSSLGNGVEDIMKNISPEQMQQAMKMYEDMTPEDREKMMQQAKDSGML